MPSAIPQRFSVAKGRPRGKSGPTPMQRLLARLMVRERKPFNRAALEAGYSERTANNGPAAMLKESPGFDKALIEESQTIPKPEVLLALSVNALADDIINGKSRGIERTVETLGKLKIHDWFVRNNDVQMGILIGVAENPPDDTALTLDEYKE